MQSLPTDNVVMGAAAAVSETLTEGGIPFYTGADSFVTAGAFATCGVNYTDLGAYTADMALDILENRHGAGIPCDGWRHHHRQHRYRDGVGH